MKVNKRLAMEVTERGKARDQKILDRAYDRLRMEILEDEDNKYRNNRLKKLDFQYLGTCRIMEISGFPSNGKKMRAITYIKTAENVGMLKEYTPKGSVDILRRALRYLWPVEANLNNFYGMRGGSTELRGILHLPVIGKYSTDEQITAVLLSTKGTIAMHVKNYINVDRQIASVVTALQEAETRDLPILKKHPKLKENFEILIGMKPEWERIYVKSKREREKDEKIKRLERELARAKTKNPY